MIDQRNFHQSPEEIIKNAPPATRILWNHLFLICGDKLSISQLFFYGLIAGSEFATYRARRLYFALSFEVGHLAGVAAATAYVAFYNEHNVNTYALQNNSTIWDATAAAARYQTFSYETRDIYFSRITVPATVTLMKFIGYRIIY